MAAAARRAVIVDSDVLSSKKGVLLAGLNKGEVKVEVGLTVGKPAVGGTRDVVFALARTPVEDAVQLDDNAAVMVGEHASQVRLTLLS